MLNSKKNNLWRLTLAGIACALSAMACGQVSDERVVEDIEEESAALEYETMGGYDYHEVCFSVGPDDHDDVETCGKNITHIFVDVDGEHGCDPEYAIRLDGEKVHNLHERGGPCKGIDRDVWFPVPCDQDEAEVCVFLRNDGRRKYITVGAKAGGECAESEVVECH